MILPALFQEPTSKRKGSKILLKISLKYLMDCLVKEEPSPVSSHGFKKGKKIEKGGVFFFLDHSLSGFFRNFVLPVFFPMGCSWRIKTLRSSLFWVLFPLRSLLPPRGLVIKVTASSIFPSSVHSLYSSSACLHFIPSSDSTLSIPDSLYSTAFSCSS